MRVTYHNAGPNKGATINLTTSEVMNLLRAGHGEAQCLQLQAEMFMDQLLPSLEKAILHGDSEAEEGAT